MCLRFAASVLSSWHYKPEMSIFFVCRGSCTWDGISCSPGWFQTLCVDTDDLLWLISFYLPSIVITGLQFLFISSFYWLPQVVLGGSKRERNWTHRNDAFQNTFKHLGFCWQYVGGGRKIDVLWLNPTQLLPFLDNNFPFSSFFKLYLSKPTYSSMWDVCLCENSPMAFFHSHTSVIVLVSISWYSFMKVSMHMSHILCPSLLYAQY